MTEIEDPDWTTPEEAEEFVVKLKARIRVLEAALRAAEAVLRVIAKPESVVMKQVREALGDVQS